MKFCHDSLRVTQNPVINYKKLLCGYDLLYQKRKNAHKSYDFKVSIDLTFQTHGRMIVFPYHSKYHEEKKEKPGQVLFIRWVQKLHLTIFQQKNEFYAFFDTLRLSPYLNFENFVMEKFFCVRILHNV